MLENLYTTKMSANKKTLQNRFTKIRSKSGRLSKMMALIVSVAIAVTFVCATVVMAAYDNIESDNGIDFYVKGEIVNLEHKPFIENNTVYIPLREVFEKVGVLNDGKSKIDWDNGKIYVTITAASDDTVFYGMVEINSNLFYWSVDEPLDFEEITAGKVSDAPMLLKDDTAYAPYQYIDYMLDRGNFGGDIYDFMCIVNGENPVAFVTPCLFWPAESDTESVFDTFGTKVNPITKEEITNNGIDIEAEWLNVFAATNGTVSAVDYDSEKGNYIVITNSSGVETLYARLAKVNVNIGDNVYKRQNIGTLENGAKLHFEVKINGKYYDPQLFWKY